MEITSKTNKLIIRVIMALCVLTFIASCAQRSSHVSSSVVDFLYPHKERPIEEVKIPQLSLPLNVGIAFVPEDSYRSTLSEQSKVEILTKVARQFEQQSYVNSIQIIPSVYLNKGGSFNNLDQIKLMHNIDVIALVSYDQKQFTDEGFASFAYWTIIGAYIIPGEKNDTHTMVDAVVYDIDSRNLLFRAPGTSHVKGLATPVNLSEELRDDSLEGLQKASNVLIHNLGSELGKFEDRVRNKPDQYQVKYKRGYSSAGSIGFLLLILLCIVIKKVNTNRQLRYCE